MRRSAAAQSTRGGSDLRLGISFLSVRRIAADFGASPCTTVLRAEGHAGAATVRALHPHSHLLRLMFSAAPRKRCALGSSSSFLSARPQSSSGMTSRPTRTESSTSGARGGLPLAPPRPAPALCPRPPFPRLGSLSAPFPLLPSAPGTPSRRPSAGGRRTRTSSGIHGRKARPRRPARRRPPIPQTLPVPDFPLLGLPSEPPPRRRRRGEHQRRARRHQGGGGAGALCRLTFPPFPFLVSCPCLLPSTGPHPPSPAAPQLMQEALGLRPKTERRADTVMGEAELREFLKRNPDGDGAPWRRLPLVPPRATRSSGGAHGGAP